MLAALGVFFDSSADKQNHRRYRVAPGVQRFRKSNQIDRATAFLQTRHFSKDMTVWAGVKIVLPTTLGYIIPAFVI